MLRIISSANRDRHQDLLEKLWTSRYRVTHDQWGWRVPGVKAGRDHDAFDTDDTLYVVVTDAADETIAAAVRLNPGWRPHMLTELFSECCDLLAPPTDRATFEFSRYIVDFDACDRATCFAAMNRLEVAICKLCLASGVDRVTWFTRKAVYRRTAKAWRTEPLGTPAYFAQDDEHYIAGQSFMEPDGLGRATQLYRLGEADLRTIDEAVRPHVPVLLDLIHEDQAQHAA